MADTASPALTTTGSDRAFARAQAVLPGGVNSPVRAFKGVGGTPVFMNRAEGPYVYDVDGNRYIDCVGAYGPMVLGHAHPTVTKAITEQAARGWAYGAPTDPESDLAEMIIAAVPTIEMVRLVNSGTEACMSALRLARAFTGRELIVKFSGGYHGHWDCLLSEAGSGVATLGIPGCPGVPAAIAASTLSVPYNDVAALQAVFAAHGAQIAAVIVEPVSGNMGVVPPTAEFRNALRELTRQHGALLVYDEVMTGFRVAYGGAQALFGDAPDLTCLGKIIGGGLPVGAYGGRKDIMQMVAPAGPMYQAGTLSGSPIPVAAGIATLQVLQATGTYDRLERTGARLAAGLQEACDAAGVPARINRVGSMITLFFTASPVTDYATAKQSDAKRFATFFHGMLDRGVYLPPSAYEAWFLSSAHDDAVIDTMLAAAREVIAGL
jgi:glutamate-1-semialdehyde 2,1-aminomutase